MSDEEGATNLGLSKELLKQLSEMQANMETIDQHIRDMASQVDQLDHLMVDMLGRLQAVERKTACLSDRPGRKNCPHCTKIVSNPNAQVCPHCGHGLYS